MKMPQFACRFHSPTAVPPGRISPLARTRTPAGACPVEQPCALGTAPAPRGRWVPEGEPTPSQQHQPHQQSHAWGGMPPASADDATGKRKRRGNHLGPSSAAAGIRQPTGQEAAVAGQWQWQQASAYPPQPDAPWSCQNNRPPGAVPATLQPPPPRNKTHVPHGGAGGSCSSGGSVMCEVSAQSSCCTPDDDGGRSRAMGGGRLSPLEVGDAGRIERGPVPMSHSTVKR